MRRWFTPLPPIIPFPCLGRRSMPHPPLPKPQPPFACLTLPSHTSPSPSHASHSPSHTSPSLPIPHPPLPIPHLPLPMPHPPLPMLHPPLSIPHPPFPCFTLNSLASPSPSHASASLPIPHSPFPCLNLPSHASHSFPMSQPGRTLSLFMQSFLLSKTTHSYFLKLLQDFVVELSVQLVKSSC